MPSNAPIRPHSCEPRKKTGCSLGRDTGAANWAASFLVSETSRIDLYAWDKEGNLILFYVISIVFLLLYGSSDTIRTDSRTAAFRADSVFLRRITDG